ncbi:metallophosphoesterase [Methanosarcina sp. Z-7115]|uniref:Metallophosphoesterase n=1 Tax=Methanosarcina baikalica TaxID=3073890 RepID=A0ABU2D312_9EURY|nr:metallophosphoesterase [Methanosarcina sp. Z-7115]MDR7666353.1 metallophosphoesterase [Methanosarcina sp. Z-7115]
MKILAISDPHGDYSKIKKIIGRAGDFDLAVVVGDITNFGPDEKVEELMEMFDRPILAIPGNCDQRSILKALDTSKAINLHRKAEKIENIRFIGLGGSNPTPFNTPFELSEEEIEKALEEMVCSAEKAEDCGTIVLLTHAPPHGARDELPFGHVGSKAIQKFLDRVDLIVCGHIHEAKGLEQVGKTIVVNPGEACKGSCALITIEETKENKPIEVEFVEV